MSLLVEFLPKLDLSVLGLLKTAEI